MIDVDARTVRRAIGKVIVAAVIVGAALGQAVVYIARWFVRGCP